MRMLPFTVWAPGDVMRAFPHYSREATMLHMRTLGWTFISAKRDCMRFKRGDWILDINSSQGYAVYELWTPKGNLIVIVP